jgi:hypothetical protein
MIRDRRPLVPAALATAGLVVALAARPISTREILAAYVLALSAIALLYLTRLARGEESWFRTPSELERALTSRPETRVRPAELIRIERELTLGSATEEHLHGRLLPLLRDAAAARLAAKHEIDFDRRPDRARELLGDETWEIVRPDREAPVERNAPGLPLRRIAAVIDSIERL